MKEVRCMNKLDKRVEDAIKIMSETQKKFAEYRKHVKELNEKKESGKNERN